MDPYRYLSFTHELVDEGSVGSVSPRHSLIPPLTRNTAAPRVVGLAHPMGRSGDAETRRAVLRAVLEAAAAMDEPRSYTELPFVWPERRSTAMRHPDPPPPIAQLLTKKPWLVPHLATGHIPRHHEEARS